MKKKSNKKRVEISKNKEDKNLKLKKLK